MKKFASLALTTLVAVAPTLVLAQSSQEIRGRKINQQDRIAQGVRSGELTPRETSHLEHQEAAINHEERAMRAQNNGHLTAADRHLINKQQNAESKRIYRDKHNTRVR